MKRFERLLIVCLCLCLSVAAGLAQSAATSNIEGKVTDASGAVVPGANVTVRNQGTNVDRALVTNDEGRYRASLLQPGLYEVTVEMPGFKTVKVADVQLEVGATQVTDVRLEVATVAEVVNVTSEAPTVETEKTEISTTVNQTAVENLPINGRRWENFVLLTPGVNEDGNFGLVSYRGISGLYNNNTIDGADNNQAFFSEARGRTRAVYTVSQTSVKEFQVGLSNFSSEFGRAAGGTVNAVTKSGSNEFHGELFYYLRDDKFQAREPFQPSKPDERRQQFGLSFGAPIVKDRVFFFGTYDQQLRNFPYFVSLFSPTFLTQACTAPGCAATIEFFRSGQKFVGRKGLNNVVLGKFDFVINESNNATLSYNWHRWRAPNGIRTPAINFNAESDNGFDGVHTDVIIFNLNSVLGSRAVNEFRFHGGRDFEFQRPNDTGPGTSVTGGFSFGMPNFLPRPAFPDERRYQFVDNFSWNSGSHNFKVGADINYVRDLQHNLFNGGGVYSYSNLNNIAQDCPKNLSGCTQRADGARTGRHYNSFQQGFDTRGQGGRIFFTTTDYNFYAQDNIKVSRSFTLNLGLRYEYQTMPDAIAPNPAFPLTAKFNADRNNFGPRFGFAWDPGGRHTFVLRGGYGLYYGRTANSAIAAALANNGAVLKNFFFTPTSTGAPAYPTVLAAIPTTPGTNPDVQFLSRDYVRPLIHSSELHAEGEVLPDTSLSGTILYSRGQRLPLFRDTNLPAPSSTVRYLIGGAEAGRFPLYRGARPTAGVGRIIISESTVNTNYWGFVTQLTQRLRRGLQYNANLTWSSAEDDGQGSLTFFGTGTLYDPLNKRLDYSRSNFDIRLRFNNSFYWAPTFLRFDNRTMDALAGGWKFSGVLALVSSRPITGGISGGLASGVGSTNSSTTNGSGQDNRVPFIPRNGSKGTGRGTFDLRVGKDFRFSESMRLALLAEFFNITNSVNFTQFSTTQFRVASSSYDAVANLATVNLTHDTGFLAPRAASSTTFGPRDVQLGIKFIW